MKSFSRLLPTLLAALALTGCFSSTKTGKEANNPFTETSSYKGGKVSARVANKSIGDTKNNIEFPLAISEELEITSISAGSYLYGKGVGTISWEAKINNKSNKEVEANINICESSNTTTKAIARKEYYLTDCETLKIRYAPGGVSTNPLKFATTKPWTSINGSMARLCIKNVGCVERYISK